MKHLSFPQVLELFYKANFGVGIDKPRLIVTGIQAKPNDLANKTGDGIISDLNIPVISPLAKIIGLGTKSTRSK